MTFSENLSTLRRQKNLSVPELARLSGIPFQLIYRYEKGEATNVTVKTLEKLASALGVKPGDLLDCGPEERKRDG